MVGEFDGYMAAEIQQRAQFAGGKLLDALRKEGVAGLNEYLRDFPENELKATLAYVVQEWNAVSIAHNRLRHGMR
jgi:hypothetical protein